MRTFKIEFLWSLGHVDVVYHAYTTPTMHGLTPEQFSDMMLQTVGKNFEDMSQDARDYISEYFVDFDMCSDLGTLSTSAFGEV
jgi:hypothetical protein